MKITLSLFASGVRKFVFGLGKKVILANTIALIADTILSYDVSLLNTPIVWLSAVVNYTDREPAYTRVIEHKHFEFDTTSPKTVVTYEYPDDYNGENEPYYVINDDKNNLLAEKYRELADKEKNVIFGGRLAEYKYYDMDDVIKRAFDIKL